MHSIDVTDPANPRLIGEYRTEGNTTAFCSTPMGQDDVRASYTSHNPTVFGELAFISWHGGGLQAIDGTNPAAPTQAGFFTPTPLPSVTTEDPAHVEREQGRGLDVPDREERLRVRGRHPERHLRPSLHGRGQRGGAQHDLP